MSAWTDLADIKSAELNRALTVDLPAALAANDHGAALSALRRASALDEWFANEGVIAYW